MQKSKKICVRAGQSAKKKNIRKKTHKHPQELAKYHAVVFVKVCAVVVAVVCSVVCPWSVLWCVL